MYSGRSRLLSAAVVGVGGIFIPDQSHPPAQRYTDQGSRGCGTSPAVTRAVVSSRGSGVS